NGVNGGLCHGGVGESILVKSRNGTDIVVDINKKNGRLKFREALRAIRQTAELVESSTIIGDTDTGFFRTRYTNNFKSINMDFIPLFKYNAFGDDVPKEQMKEIRKLYKSDGDPLILLVPPYVARDIYSGMKMIFR
ncbi:MAG: hypothetical protein KAJ19_24540, partial [Gammaproteobacteria bacterium]|nr:hypothetical protein [Gammaproteobacteria bacterium]